MIVDKNNNVLSDPDLEKGYLTPKTLDVVYIWVVDVAAEYKEVVLADYPETGGKDIAYEVVTPEQGHWEIKDTSYNDLNLPIDEMLCETLSKGDPNYIGIQVEEYTPYTKSELKEVERKRKEREEALKAEREKQAIINELPSRVDSVENTQDDIVLLLADIVGGAI